MTLLDVVVCVWMLALSVVAVYGLIRFLAFIGDVKSDSEYLNAAVDAMDMQTKSLNTQMGHYHHRIEQCVHKIHELECHHDQLKKNMLVMHQNNQTLHEQMNVLNDQMKTVYDQMVDLKRLSINDSRVD